MAVVFDRLDYVHDVFRKEKTGDGLGTASVPDGREEFSVRVEVDMKALARIAGKAARNKKGVSVDGPLKVRVVSRSRIPA
jgi:translation initiation factor IF-1